MCIDSIDASGNDHFDCHIVIHAILAAFTAHSRMLHSTETAVHISTLLDIKVGVLAYGADESEMILVLRATMPKLQFL